MSFSSSHETTWKFALLYLTVGGGGSVWVGKRKWGVQRCPTVPLLPVCFLPPFLVTWVGLLPPSPTLYRIYAPAYRQQMVGVLRSHMAYPGTAPWTSCGILIRWNAKKRRGVSRECISPCLSLWSHGPSRKADLRDDLVYFISSKKTMRRKKRNAFTFILRRSLWREIFSSSSSVSVSRANLCDDVSVTILTSNLSHFFIFSYYLFIYQKVLPIFHTILRTDYNFVLARI